MKRIFGILMALVMVFGLSVQAHATLILRGTDSLGFQLIYDDDLDITWYDYTNAQNTWQNQVNWADALTVDFGGILYEDWRLPISDTCWGYDCTGSEMGHLYYTELGNSAGGPLGTSFTDGLTGDTESFLNLRGAWWYWSGTEYAPLPSLARVFDFGLGHQSALGKLNGDWALAVRPGDVGAAVIPEPSTWLLLGAGLAGLGLFRKKFRVRSS